MRAVGFNVENFGDDGGVTHVCMTCDNVTMRDLGSPNPGPCGSCGGVEYTVMFTMSEDRITKLMSHPKPEKRECIFCGATPVTREHVWPQWIGREFPNSDINRRYEEPTRSMPRKRLVNVTEDVSFFMAYEDEKNHGVSDATHVVKAACASCNNGWMATLEAEVKPILLRQMTDRNDQLTEEECNLLVRWLAKTAAVFEMDDPVSTVLTPENRRAIADRSTPLSDQWRMDSMWLWGFDFHLAHGRAGLLHGTTGEMGLSMIFIVTAGHAGYVVQFMDHPWVGQRRLGLTRRIQLWPRFQSDRRRPRVGLIRWHRMKAGGYLYKLPRGSRLPT